MSANAVFMAKAGNVAPLPLVATPPLRAVGALTASRTSASLPLELEMSFWMLRPSSSAAR
jgi:hypothetical protein